MSESNGNNAVADLEALVRADGILQNALTGMGDINYDRSESTTVGYASRLSRFQLEELACNWICNNIVSSYPHEATRAWLEVTLGGDKTDSKVLSGFNEYQKKLNVQGCFEWADYLANLYKGSVIVIIADDGEDYDKPLRRDNIRTIKALEILDCYDIYPDLGMGQSPLKPERYLLAIDPIRFPDLQGVGSYIHHTRILRFDGVKIPPKAMERSIPRGWGASRMELAFDALVDYESAHSSVAEMANSFNVFKMAIQGLAAKIGEGGNKAEEVLKTRFRAIQQMMSVLKGIVVDADKESVDFVSRNFAGIADVLDRFANRLVGASDLPYTVLFGRGPGGLAAQGTGASEDAVWAKKVGQYQESKYRPLFQEIAELIWLAKDGPTKGKIPEDWGFKFDSLEKDTDQTVMQARQLAAQAYSTYVQMGALLPEEVRQSQFGGAEYSFEINLDEKLWDKKQKEQEDQAQQAQQAQYGGYYDQSQYDQGQPQDDGSGEAQYDSLVTDSELYDRAIAETKNRYQVSDTPYAKKYALRRYKQLYKDSHNTLSGAFKVVQKDSRDEPWVRIGDGGQVVGLCRLDGDRSTCLPQSRAEAMSADERKLFIQRKKNNG
jgi:phage-related protein (TIGR01555 family)